MDLSTAQQKLKDTRAKCDRDVKELTRIIEQLQKKLQTTEDPSKRRSVKQLMESTSGKAGKLMKKQGQVASKLMKEHGAAAASGWMRGVHDGFRAVGARLTLPALL